MESVQGGDTAKQARRIRQLFEDFEAESVNARLEQRKHITRKITAAADAASITAVSGCGETRYGKFCCPDVSADI